MRLQSSSKLKVPKLHIFSDSKLVVNQVMGKFETWGAKMAKYLVVTKNLLTEFRIVKIEQVSRDLNSHADALAGLASVFSPLIHQPMRDLIPFTSPWPFA